VKIYLAGKIYRNDWRHSIVDGLGEVSPYPGEWPILKEAIFATHDYVGPYFLSLGHGQSHNKREYGHATEVVPEGHGSTYEIVEACIDAIKQCDTLFAYIQSRECFGTFCEIGYAVAAGKRTAVCYAPLIDDHHDMWFLNRAVSRVEYDVTDPEEQLRKWYPQILPPAIESVYSTEPPGFNNGQIDWRVMPDGNERRQAYYCSLEWESLRQGVISRARGYCEQCQSEPICLVHHLTYARLYKEHLEDLQGLCEKCHHRLHPSRVRSSC
jgi:hypothetical protein